MAVEVGSQRHRDGGRAGLAQVDESGEEAVSARVVVTERERLLELIDDDDRRATADRSAQRPLRIRAGRDDGGRPSRASEERRRRARPGRATTCRFPRRPRPPGSRSRGSPRRRSRRSPRARRRGPRPRSGTPSGRGTGHTSACGGAREPGTDERPAPLRLVAAVRQLRESEISWKPFSEPARDGARRPRTCLGAASASRRAADVGKLSLVPPRTRHRVTGGDTDSRAEPSGQRASSLESVLGRRERGDVRTVVDGCDAVASARAGRARPPRPRLLRPSTSAMTRVTAPAGRSAPHQRRSLATKAAADASRRSGSVARLGRTIRSKAATRSGSIVPHVGGPPEGASPVSRATAVAASA